MASYYAPPFGFSYEFPLKAGSALLIRDGSVDAAALRQTVRNAVERSFGVPARTEDLTTWKSVSVTQVPYQASGGGMESAFGPLPAAVLKVARRGVSRPLRDALGERALELVYWTESDLPPAPPREPALYLRIDVRLRRNAVAPVLLVTQFPDLDILTSDFFAGLGLNS
ncbi:MAG TPA: hypothetical protein VE981_01410 [Planctomycetota bacterium]|nr:hypothetical protein [Planctomycetota bacterium]